MNRHETTGGTREIGRCGFINLNFISITDSTAQIRMKSTGYEIYIKCIPTDSLRECLTSILEKNQETRAELKDAIIIYKPKKA